MHPYDTPEGWDYLAVPGWPYDRFQGNPPIVDIGDNFKVPSHFTGIATEKRSGMTIALCFHAAPGRGMNLVAVMGADELTFPLELAVKTGSVLKWKYVAAMQLVDDEAAVDAAGGWKRSEEQQALTTAQRKERARELLAPLLDQMPGPPPAQGPGGRRNLTPEHLATVAEVYRTAHEQGQPPTKTVADHFDISHSTAAKWVGAARKQGLLGQVRKGSRGSNEGDEG
ncbi:hypothetical protein ACWD4B_09905 [Streptomyces sp. NPDC002536]|uniref:Uncharacterized protein n=1 Tax=Streptomyces morookaense TaxID=1970 RepID=A0A7Y7B9F2_STRMO|nr:hypothetical protein [Streptomyces morookaense]NVK81472.1 hypothetical protein [Streptomyces morookaense]GHF25330.1 hypothetical protein GCM10010359_29150 [Streptomyces morookaense]